MKTLFSFLCFLSFSLAQAQSADEKAVLDTEKSRFAAQVAKDYPVLEQVLADDLVYNHSNGNSDGKQAYIQSIRDGKSIYNAIDLQESKVRVYGKTAVINGIALVKLGSATNPGQVTDLKLKYTDVYVKRGKTWQMVAWQSLRLPQEAPLAK